MATFHWSLARGKATSTTHHTYTNILEGRMIQLSRRAVALPLIIHRRQYLKTRSSLKLLPDSATYVTRLWGLSRRAYMEYTNSLSRNILQTLFRRYVSRNVPTFKDRAKAKGGLHLTLYLAIINLQAILACVELMIKAFKLRAFLLVPSPRNT